VPVFGRARRRVVGAAATAVCCCALAPGATAIVGGRAISVQAAPWTAYIEAQGPSGYACSGVILDRLHLVTAADCLFDSSGKVEVPAQLTVKVGTSNVVSPAAGDAVQSRGVSSFTVDPGYVWASTPQPDDVAVVALSSPLDLSGSTAEAVALPAPGAAFPAGLVAGVAGFGAETSGQDLNGQLNEVSETVDPQGRCGAALAADEVLEDDATSFCASAAGAAVCSGDGGAGLVTSGSTPTLIGVVTSIPSGCSAGGHSTFTYVAAPEILDFLQGNQQPPTAVRLTASTGVDISWPETPPRVGDTLSCTSSGWGSGSLSFAYRFLTGTGTLLQSGTSPSYVIGSAELGAQIECDVAATNAGGTTLELGSLTPVVAAARPPKIANVIAGSPAVRGKWVRYSVDVSAQPGLHATLRVCLVPPGNVARRACLSKRVGGGGSGYTIFTLQLAIKPRAPVRSVRLEVTVSGGGLHAARTVGLRIHAG
jgi:Trypsin